MKLYSNTGLLAILTSFPFISRTDATTNTTLPVAIPSASWAATYASTAYPQSTRDLAQIINTLALYPLAIDGQNFSALSLVFTQDVIADYPVGGIGAVESLPVLEQAITTASQYTTSQHSHGTQLVKITSKGHAKSLTYFTATLFGKGKYYGEVSQYLFYAVAALRDRVP